MSITSKSPTGVAREALAIGSAALCEYTHLNSPKIYTQPQLFSCLVLKVFFKTDYRGICQYLADLPELRAVLGLQKVPHFTTLQKAARRLLTARRVKRLLRRTVRCMLGRKRKIKRGCL